MEFSLKVKLRGIHSHVITRLPRFAWTQILEAILIVSFSHFGFELGFFCDATSLCRGEDASGANSQPQIYDSQSQHRGLGHGFLFKSEGTHGWDSALLEFNFTV